MQADRIGLEGDQDFGAPLLQPVMRGGRLVAPLPTLAAIRERVRAQFAALPPALRALAPAEPYPVAIAPSLEALARQVEAQRRAAIRAESGPGGDPPAHA
jgi:nicotinate phosphoribosyltransferase